MRKAYKCVLVFGSGPIKIGQACEFDYSGTQACQALKEEGIKVVLINSNPATIMTDPDLADKTYIEPLTPQSVIEILRKEACDAILPTTGGQTGINLLLALSKYSGALDHVDVLGANLKSIHLAEDRKAFSEVVKQLGLDSCRSKIIRSLEEARDYVDTVGYPFILRPSFTLGGSGQSFVFNEEEFDHKVSKAIDLSPIGETLLEESILGWKEYELEVVRDTADNAIVVCSIENVDAMGVHTGDSITVAPQQTLTDREYQKMRQASLDIVRAVGVETGGCNVQFSVNPETGRQVVIEMNPRVSRSSALASKVTGFPIAYVATKLALGYKLSEIDNKVTQKTKACFEPPIDYVAVKIPRWNFEKFDGIKDELGPQMRSVGESLGIGGSFAEAFHKALVGLERKWPDIKNKEHQAQWDLEDIRQAHSLRAFAIWDSLAQNRNLDGALDWDPWFVRQLSQYIKKNKFTPKQIIRSSQKFYRMIDTCAAEYEVKTPYYYSTSEQLSPALEQNELNWGKARKKAVVIGSGPNRIGQGVEFDYCCVHASQSLQKLGYETIMINCNPETVSTDPTVSDRLYLEPITLDSVKSILDLELGSLPDSLKKESFVLLQTGGQTPLKLADHIEAWGYQSLGNGRRPIELCEDRKLFAEILDQLDLMYPDFGMATSYEEVKEVVERIGLPVLIRPSFVLGGRAMQICSKPEDLKKAYDEAKMVSEDFPLYIDKFLVDAIEFDVDGICDGKKAWIAGVMEHVEQAGVHSGDSSCVIPPLRLPPELIDRMADIAKKIALKVGAKGFFNVQMAVDKDKIYVIECNPRASRTIPFLAKATGYPLVTWAMRASLGESIKDIVDNEGDIPGNYRLKGRGFAVKSPVFPFDKFPEYDPILGPEMRSTGEVMGLDTSPGGAFAKAFIASGMNVPLRGTCLLSVHSDHKPALMNLARMYSLLGFDLMGTPGTADYLNGSGLKCTRVNKLSEPGNPNGLDVVQVIKKGHVQLIINTTQSLSSIQDALNIRQAALRYRVPLLSTLAAAEMMSMAIQVLRDQGIRPLALQDFYERNNFN